MCEREEKIVRVCEENIVCACVFERAEKTAQILLIPRHAKF